MNAFNKTFFISRDLMFEVCLVSKSETRYLSWKMQKCDMIHIFRGDGEVDKSIRRVSSCSDYKDRNLEYGSTPVSGVWISSQNLYPDIQNPDTVCPVIKVCLDCFAIRTLFCLLFKFPGNPIIITTYFEIWTLILSRFECPDIEACLYIESFFFMLWKADIWKLGYYCISLPVSTSVWFIVLFKLMFLLEKHVSVKWQWKIRKQVFLKYNRSMSSLIIKTLVIDHCSLVFETIR